MLPLCLHSVEVRADTRGKSSPGGLAGRRGIQNFTVSPEGSACSDFIPRDPIWA